MLIAIDNNGNRVQAFKGGFGKCQLCGNEVRAYCGEINIHHWRHIDLKKCDFWKENETEWHRQWKEHFPIEWQEVVIKNDGQIHRADIKTNSDLVVEFQNSSISSGEVKQRERFYGDMIWLINAIEFKENFQLWSLVKYQLKVLEDSYSSYYYSYGESDSHEVETQKETVSDIKGKISSNNYEIEKTNSNIKEIRKLKESFKKTTKEYINGNYGYFSPMKDFNSNTKDLYINLKSEHGKLKSSYTQKDELLNKIESFQKCKINGLENYHIVDYKYINSKHFRICKLVKKENFNSLFPDIINFNSENDFERMARNQNYILIIDFSTIIQKLENEKQKLKEEIIDNKRLRRKHKNTLKTKIKDFLNKRLTKAKKSLSKKNTIDTDFENELYHEEEKLKKIKEQEEIDDIESQPKAFKEKEKRRFEIMKEYKGMYGYNWKYRRKTWDYSNRPLYLDFGTSIFQIQNDSTLRKIPYEEFISFIKAYSKKT